MGMKVHVVAYGSLFRWLSSGERGEHRSLDAGDTLNDLIRKLNIPNEEVWMATVNGLKADWDQTLQDGDEVRLFSPLGGGS